MERAFIATSKSEFMTAYNRYKEAEIKQKDFVFRFLKEKGFESEEYYVSGDGIVNQPFASHSKDKIGLYIKPTNADIEQHGKHLKKANKHGFNDFNKKSTIAKEFAQKMVDEKIVVNLYSPRPRDYFDSIGYGAYSYQMFVLNGVIYMKIDCKQFKNDDIPQGFEEIKLSDYYLAKEEREKAVVHK